MMRVYHVIVHLNDYLHSKCETLSGNLDPQNLTYEQVRRKHCTVNDSEHLIYGVTEFMVRTGSEIHLDTLYNAAVEDVGERYAAASQLWTKPINKVCESECAVWVTFRLIGRRVRGSWVFAAIEEMNSWEGCLNAIS